MVKPTSDDIKKQVAAQNDDNYNDAVTDGSTNSADPYDIDKGLGDAYGPDAEEQVKEGIPFNMSDEMDKDTRDQAGDQSNEETEEIVDPLKKAA